MLVMNSGDSGDGVVEMAKSARSTGTVSMAGVDASGSGGKIALISSSFFLDGMGRGTVVRKETER